jgi:hypothetical protein
MMPVMPIEGPIVTVVVMPVERPIVAIVVMPVVAVATPSRRRPSCRNTQAARKGRYRRVFSKVLQHGSPPLKLPRGKRYPASTARIMTPAPRSGRWGEGRDQDAGGAQVSQERAQLNPEPYVGFMT